MVDKKSVTLNSLITTALIVVSMIIPVMWEPDAEPVYFCEARPEVGFVHCDGFSKYVSPVGKCLGAEWQSIALGNKICREGWVLVTNDLDLSDSEVETSINPPAQGDYNCKPVNKGGCIKI